jgi:hypothetical protein
VAGRGWLGISSGRLNQSPLPLAPCPFWCGLGAPGPMSACSGPVGLLGVWRQSESLGPGCAPCAHCLRGLVPAEPIVRSYPAVCWAAAWLVQGPGLVQVSTPGPGSCSSRGRLRAGPGVCRGLALAELGVCGWRGLCCRQHGGSQSPYSACLHRVASCRPVESAEDLGTVRWGPVLSGRKFQSHPGVPPGRLIVII